MRTYFVADGIGRWKYHVDSRSILVRKLGLGEQVEVMIVVHFAGMSLMQVFLNKIGKVYLMEDTEIPKACFMPHHGF
jgi:VCBS repeat-containing protein